MIRLFTGIEIPKSIAEQLSWMQGGLENARWIDPGSYHITLRFIGDVEEYLAEAIDDGLRSIRADAFSLCLHTVGYFGNRKPRSVWAGIDASPALTNLQSAHEQVCQRAGLEPEGRKFTPHITLARLRHAKLSGVRDYIAAHSQFATPPFPVEKFVLFSARNSKGGGPYVAERTYPLS